MAIIRTIVKGPCARLKCAKIKEIITEKKAYDHLRFILTNKNKIRRTHRKKILLLILGGVLIGFINGFFGGGGGMICVPILEKVLSLDNKVAHANSILVIFPLSLISGIVYSLSGYISFYPLLLVSIGVIFGGILGAILLKYLPSKIIKILFAIIMFLGGIKLIL